MSDESDTTPSENVGVETDLRTRFHGFQSRAKAEWALVEARARTELQAFPTRLKQGASQALDRLRSGLDLPSRGELAALSARLDELATKLAAYESQGGGKGRKAKETQAS